LKLRAEALHIPKLETLAKPKLQVLTVFKVNENLRCAKIQKMRGFAL